MLVETVVQWVAPMLLELAIRDVAVPAAKRLVREGVAQRSGRVADADIAGAARTAALLSPVQAVQVVSAISGRVRVEVAGLRGQASLARRLEQEVGVLIGVLEAKANTQTGRMLVQFEPESQSLDTVIGAIDRTRTACLPPVASRTRHLAAVV